MRIQRGFESRAGAGRAVAIGNFDGVHLGHQQILAVLCRHGRESLSPTAVVCFEPQPKEYFAKGEAPARLMRLRDKAARIAEAGVDELRVLRFGARLARLDADEFIGQLLVGALRANHVVIGEGFRFGHERRGDVGVLRRAGGVHGFAVDAVAPCLDGGRPVSSTRVREALAAGRLAEARALLGRDYCMSGRVVAGERLGRTLGFPTANLRLHRRVSPVSGIFAVRVSGGGLARHPGVASVGTRPTVDGREWLLEVHAFDFEGDLYGERLDVDFVARLRDEIRFPDLESMSRRMQDDAREARRLLTT